MVPKIVLWSFALLLIALPARAAPTCLNRQGDAVRCEAPGAMPVGWKPSPQQIWDRQLSLPPGPSTGRIVEVFLGLGLLLVIIALMPNFDGEKWDRQEGDDP